MYDAKDKVVFITGAADGIGARTVRSFLDGGAKQVAALDISIEKGKALEHELTAKYGSNKIKFYKCDVTTNELDDVFDNVIENFGHIDVVVNCAGIMNDAPNIYLKEIEINISAVIKSSLKSYELMRNDRGGRGGTIINISSIVGLIQTSSLPVYSATKSAVLQFSNCLGKEPHYSRSEVRVLTICFGKTETNIISPSKIGGIDQETDIYIQEALDVVPSQNTESAVNGLMHVFKNGESASTWLVTSGRPAEDITERVKNAYKLMSQGVYN